MFQQTASKTFFNIEPRVIESHPVERKKNRNAWAYLLRSLVAAEVLFPI